LPVCQARIDIVMLCELFLACVGLLTHDERRICNLLRRNGRNLLLAEGGDVSSTGADIVCR
jgi:hypothetical protein